MERLLNEMYLETWTSRKKGTTETLRYSTRINAVPGKKESLAVIDWLGLRNGPGTAGVQQTEHDPAVCPGSKKGILDCGSMSTARRSMEVIIPLYSGRIRPYLAAATRFRLLSTRHSPTGMSSAQIIDMERATALAWCLVWDQGLSPLPVGRLSRR